MRFYLYEVQKEIKLSYSHRKQHTCLSDMPRKDSNKFFRGARHVPEPGGSSYIGYIHMKILQSKYLQINKFCILHTLLYCLCLCSPKKENRTTNKH